MEPRSEAGRTFLDDWAPTAMSDHESGCRDCEGTIEQERVELADRILAIEDEAHNLALDTVAEAVKGQFGWARRSEDSLDRAAVLHIIEEARRG